jgi:hypothetical protein
MNKFVFSTLATALVGATSFANDTAWPELDRELAALSNAPLTQDAGGLSVSGWLIAAITSADAAVDGDPDQLGTGVAASRVNLSGSLGNNYSFALGWDFTDAGELYAPQGVPVATNGVGGLTDAYASFGVADGLDVTFGIFRRTFLRSSSIQRNRTLFIDRSALGGAHSGRDAGIGLSGNFNKVNWELTVMNGADGQTDEFAYSLHVDMDVIGSSSGNEGALNAAEGTNLNIGLSYLDDGSEVGGVDLDDTQTAVYAALTTGAFSAAIEMVQNDDDNGDNSPYSIGLGYLFGGNYEVAARWDDHDDDDPSNTTRMTLGVNRYIDGHDIKWQLNYSTGDSDDDSEAPDEIALGLACGF